MALFMLPAGMTSAAGPLQKSQENAPIRLPVIDAKDLRFTRFSTEQGLSRSRVDHMLQDNHGFLWFGTHNGLNRFDGYQRLLRHQLLQLPVLVFQLPQPLRLADLQTAILRLPAIECLLADAVLIKLFLLKRIQRIPKSSQILAHIRRWDTGHWLRKAKTQICNGFVKRRRKSAMMVERFCLSFWNYCRISPMRPTA